MLQHLLVLGVLFTEIGGILAEVVPLQVLRSLDLLVVIFLILEGSLKLNLLGFQSLDVRLLAFLLLGDALGLTPVDGELVFLVLGLDLALKQLALLGDSLDIGSQTLQLSLGGLRLLQDHFEALKSLLLVLEFTANDFIVYLSVLAGLISQIVQHLLWTEILTSDLLSVHQALSHGKELVFTHFNVLGQLTLLLIESSILLLLFSELGGGLEESLEIVGVSPVLEEGDLGEQLFLFLLELGDFLLEL